MMVRSRSAARIGIGAAAALCVAASLGAARVALAEAGVYERAEDVQPLKPGAAIPAASLRSVRGEAVELSAALGGRGCLLVFYRGGW